MIVFVLNLCGGWKECNTLEEVFEEVRQQAASDPDAPLHFSVEKLNTEDFE